MLSSQIKLSGLFLNICSATLNYGTNWGEQVHYSKNQVFSSLTYYKCFTSSLLLSCFAPIHNFKAPPTSRNLQRQKDYLWMFSLRGSKIYMYFYPTTKSRGFERSFLLFFFLFSHFPITSYFLYHNSYYYFAKHF